MTKMSRTDSDQLGLAGKIAGFVHRDKEAAGNGWAEDYSR